MDNPTINPDHFTSALYLLLDETFDKVHGLYLDEGTTMFETLDTITAEEASVPVGGRCATLAAQVKHVSFFLDVIDKSVRYPQTPEADWDQIWRETGSVNPEEWEMLKNDLRESYNRIKILIQEIPVWSSEDAISGAMGVVVHTAYHLGEIRQAVGCLQS